MNLTSLLKGLAQSWGMGYVGVATVDMTYQMAAFDKHRCLSAPCAVCLVRCPVGNQKTP